LTIIFTHIPVLDIHWISEWEKSYSLQKYKFLKILFLKNIGYSLKQYTHIRFNWTIFDSTTPHKNVAHIGNFGYCILKKCKFWREIFQKWPRGQYELLNKVTLTPRFNTSWYGIRSHNDPEKIIDQKNPPRYIWCIFNGMTPYQVVLGQKWKNCTTRLRDILPFSQGHALKRIVQSKFIKGKK